MIIEYLLMFINNLSALMISLQNCLKLQLCIFKVYMYNKIVKDKLLLMK